MVSLVYDNASGELHIPNELKPISGEFFPHHFQSTPPDNLIELAGRVCYDSTKSEKTRNSKEYHQHINEVNHGSVQEHATVTVELSNIRPEALVLSCLNRPAVFLSFLSGKYRITANIRAIKEWDVFDNIRLLESAGFHSSCGKETGFFLKETVQKKCPLALSEIIKTKNNSIVGEIVTPQLPEERWLSFYIRGVSRGLTHELVRHKFRTAVSQRSTRYVDESESIWAWHPLIKKYGLLEKNLMNDPYSDPRDVIDIEWQCREAYEKLVTELQSKMLQDGYDSMTAKKQARGAARGILGNALSTELIWSASLDQIKRVLLQRSSEHADMEIRVWANDLFNCVKHIEYFHDLVVVPLKDGTFQLNLSV